MMTGCQSSIKPQALQIPANLKEPCPDLQKLESGQGKEVLRIMTDDRRKYVECRNRHSALVNAVQKPPQ